MENKTNRKVYLVIENLCELIEESEDYEEIIELTKALSQLITAIALHS